MCVCVFTTGLITHSLSHMEYTSYSLQIIEMFDASQCEVHVHRSNSDELYIQN